MSRSEVLRLLDGVCAGIALVLGAGLVLFIGGGVFGFAVLFLSELAVG